MLPEQLGQDLSVRVALYWELRSSCWQWVQSDILLGKGLGMLTSWEGSLPQNYVVIKGLTSISQTHLDVQVEMVVRAGTSWRGQ